MQQRFDAVILAGYDRNKRQTKPDPLVEQSGEPHKVLIKIAGQPMIWHVVKALTESQAVDRVIIVGLSPEDGVDFGREVYYLPDQGRMLDNIARGFTWMAQTKSPEQYGLLVTGDVPLLTGAMVDWFVQACQPLQKDIYWGIVEKQTMEVTFPNSQRSYLRLIEGNFCSADLYLGTIQAALARQALIQAMIDNRKNVFRQLRLLGFGVVIKFLLRRLRLPDVLGVVERALNLTGAAVILPFAEPGMDVDKPHQLAQVLAYLEKRSPGSTVGEQLDSTGIRHA